MRGKRVMMVSGLIRDMRIEDLMQGTSLGSKMVGIEIKKGPNLVGAIYMQGGLILDVKPYGRTVKLEDRIALLRDFLRGDADTFEVYKWDDQRMTVPPVGDMNNVLLRVFTDEPEEATNATTSPPRLPSAASLGVVPSSPFPSGGSVPPGGTPSSGSRMLSGGTPSSGSRGIPIVSPAPLSSSGIVMTAESAAVLPAAQGYVDVFSSVVQPIPQPPAPVPTEADAPQSIAARTVVDDGPPFTPEPISASGTFVTASDERRIVFAEVWRGLRLVMIVGAIAVGVVGRLTPTFSSAVHEISLVMFGVGLLSLLRK